MGDCHEIWTLIDRSNDAWTAGRPADAGLLYADDAVLVAPGLADTVRGRDAITETYVQFLAAARVERFDVDRRSLHTFDATAIAAYVFEIDYTMGDTAHSERGEEILLLHRRESGWQVSWRTQVALEATRT